MTLKSLLLAKAILAILDSKETSKYVCSIAQNIDKEIDKRFGGESENIQASIIQKVLLPLCSDLMMEQQKEYMNLLRIELQLASDEFTEDKLEVN